jgi:hypothetical protein
VQVDKLVTGISKRTSQQQDMLLRLVVAALEHMAEMPHALKAGKEFSSKYAEHPMYFLSIMMSHGKICVTACYQMGMLSDYSCAICTAKQVEHGRSRLPSPDEAAP